MATEKLKSYCQAQGLETFRVSGTTDLAAVLARLARDPSAFVIAQNPTETAMLAFRASDIRSLTIAPGLSGRFDIEIHTIHDEIHNVTVEKS